MMTRFLAILFLLSATARAEFTIVATGHREAASFTRISEYFTGRENPGRYSLFRSDPARRQGFYVSLLTQDGDALSAVAKVRIQFIRAASLDVETREIADATIDKDRLLVGLTDAEWADPSARPLAWRIELLDATGDVVDSAQSFLWAEPTS